MSTPDQLTHLNDTVSAENLPPAPEGLDETNATGAGAYIDPSNADA